MFNLTTATFTSYVLEKRRRRRRHKVTICQWKGRKKKRAHRTREREREREREKERSSLYGECKHHQSIYLAWKAGERWSKRRGKSGREYAIDWTNNSCIKHHKSIKGGEKQQKHCCTSEFHAQVLHKLRVSSSCFFSSLSHGWCSCICFYLCIQNKSNVHSIAHQFTTGYNRSVLQYILWVKGENWRKCLARERERECDFRLCHANFYSVNLHTEAIQGCQEKTIRRHTETM